MNEPMHDSNVMHTHPILGAVLALVTGASSLTLMQFTHGIISIVVGLLSICLLIIQLRKALKS